MAAAWQAYDAWVSRQVFHGLDAVGLHKPGALASPLTRDLPLIASPTPQVTAVACYLAVVLLGVARLKALGPSAQPLPCIACSLLETLWSGLSVDLVLICCPTAHHFA